MLTRRAIAAGCALLAVASACSSAQKYVAPATPSTTRAAAPATTARAPASTSPGGTASTSTSILSGPVTTTTVAPPTQPTTEPTTPPTLPPLSLASLILADVPSGYTRLADSVGQTGPTNLALAIESDNSANARRALLVTGFVGGYQRQWTSADGYTIDQDFLYQFHTPKGAEGYAQHWHDTLVQSNQTGSVLQPFTPAFVPGALGLQTKTTTGSTAVVMFAKGIYAVEATVNGGAVSAGAPIDQSGAATAFAVAQYQRLP